MQVCEWPRGDSDASDLSLGVESVILQGMAARVGMLGGWKGLGEEARGSETKAQLDRVTCI